MSGKIDLTGWAFTRIIEHFRSDLPSARADATTAGCTPIAAFPTMSTIHQPAATAEYRPSESASVRAERALRLFERVVWHDRGVCSHCFSRLREFAELETDKWGNSYIETRRTGSAVDGWDLDDPDDSVASVHPIARERTTCGECGSVGGLAQPDTLSLEDALDRVPKLVARYEEADHDVNQNAVYDAVRHLKTSEEYRNQDKRIFAAAAYLGLQHE